MKNNESKKLKDKQKQVEKMVYEFTDVMAVDAKNHFKKSFELGGFVDKVLDPWAKRKSKKDDSGRAILVKSSELKDSIMTEPIREGVRVTSDKDYAKIHNEGGTGSAWGKYTFKMVKRQFIGYSERLKMNLRQKIKRRIARIFKF